MTSLADCARLPGAPLTTSLPFYESGMRRTNWLSCCQPLLVVVVLVSGK
jgi:hypothetical protein